jgi:hypothetical protein
MSPGTVNEQKSPEISSNCHGGYSRPSRLPTSAVTVTVDADGVPLAEMNFFT